MRVNCNISAVIANNQLGKSQDKLDSAIERLSSGLRINHAEDDAAGMAIAKKMHTQIKALDQANRNASDGISVVQTAESALSEVESMLQRARELAVQAADGTYSDEDRAAIQSEITQISAEVDRVSKDTEFNTISLLDGSLGRRTYFDQDGMGILSLSDTVSAGDYVFSVTTPATRAELQIPAMGGSVPTGLSGKMTINGAEVEVKSGDTYDEIYDKIMDACNRSNVIAERTAAGITCTNEEYGFLQTIDIEFSSDELAGFFGMDKQNTAAGTDCEVELKDGFSDTASIITDGNKVTVRDVNNFTMKFEVPGDKISTDVSMKITDIGAMVVQIGANEGQELAIDIPKMDSHILGIDGLNLCATKTAGSAIAKLDEAISQVSALRSRLGAYQNRLESTVESIDTYNENITSALSRIEDCDMAEEMTEYTSHNVVTQAATSILSQANERPQSVLQLLS